MEMQSILEWEHGQLTEEFRNLPAPWPRGLGDGPADSPKAGNSWLFPGLLGFVMLSLLVTAILLFGRDSRSGPATVMAHLADMSERGGPPAWPRRRRSAVPLGPGLVRLEAGTVQIAFTSGAVAP